MASTQQVPAGGQAVPGGQVVPGGQAVAAGVRPVAAPAGGAGQTADAAGASAGQALVPAPRQLGEEESEPEFGPLVARLPVELDVAVPVRDFRVRQLLALAPGETIASQWNHGIDLPLAAGDVQLAWSEFEVLDTKLAVRVTRLA
jgi:flagellar motor switch protein FliN/FliY